MKIYKLIYIGNANNMTKNKEYECTKHTFNKGTCKYYETLNDNGDKVEFFPDAFLNGWLTK